MQLSSEELSKY